MKLCNFFRRRVSRAPLRSYAQSGEDCIVDYILKNLLGIAQPSYLDIGAHHARDLSNTYHFYSQGCRGVCVEPNPVLHAAIQKIRKRDTCLNAGIAGSDEQAADFFVLDPPTMSTFSKVECDRFVQKGYHLKGTIKVPLMTIGTLVPRYFPTHPNFVSIDTEGYDLTILEGWNFDRFRPEVFCVETVEHVSEEKIPGFDERMIACGYFKYADTFVNTIYIEGTSFARRRR